MLTSEGCSRTANKQLDPVVRQQGLFMWEFAAERTRVPGGFFGASCPTAVLFKFDRRKLGVSSKTWYRGHS